MAVEIPSLENHFRPKIPREGSRADRSLAKIAAFLAVWHGAAAVLKGRRGNLGYRAKECAVAAWNSDRFAAFVVE
jgi:hypothetical protein